MVLAWRLLELEFMGSKSARKILEQLNMLKKQRLMRLIYVRSCSGEVKGLIIEMIHGQEDLGALIGVYEETGKLERKRKGILF